MEVKPGQFVEEKLSIGAPAPKPFAPLPPDTLKIIPLGGVGEIGKNLTLIEYNSQILIIDCGVKFPNEAELPGIDLVIPDLSYLYERKSKVLAVVLTHGHEDHIGSLPYLLKQIPLPVYGTRYTLGLVRSKLEEHRIPMELKEVHAGGKIELGAFKIEFFSVCHSIVDGVGLAIDTPKGLIVHSGDFKLDKNPVDGIQTDVDTLRRLGERGVLALLSDSTNVERGGYTPSERDLKPGFEHVFGATKRRVIATCFASNVHRFQQILEVAHQFGRKVATLGLSMNYNMRLAQEQGYLRPPNGTWISYDNLMDIAPNRTVVVSTGSQGEPMSGLARMAAGTHTDIRVEEGDSLLYSARAIPGNERTINTVINNFYRRGAEVFTESRVLVHVSGHGSTEDLRTLLRLVKPRFFLPAHGEVRHQVLHRNLAHDCGIPQENVFMLENGACWAWDGREAWVHGSVPAGEVLVDGKGLGDVNDVVLRDRRHLSEDGMVLCLLGVSAQRGEILAGPDIITRGLIYAQDQNLMEEAKKLVRDALANRQGAMTPGWDELRAIVVEVLKRFFKQRTERRPMILPVVMEV